MQFVDSFSNKGVSKETATEVNMLFIFDLGQDKHNKLFCLLVLCLQRATREVKQES